MAHILPPWGGKRKGEEIYVCHRWCLQNFYRLAWCQKWQDICGLLMWWLHITFCAISTNNRIISNVRHSCKKHHKIWPSHFQNAAVDATLGSRWGQHRYVTSVPQNNTGSHFYVKKFQKTCDCLCEWYGANSEDAGRNECRRFYVFFLSWPCLANTPIRESQSLNKNIIAGKFDFTVVIFQLI